MSKMGFLEVESTPGVDALKTVEMTTKDLEYYINSADKTAAEFERFDSDFERSSTVGKMLPKQHCTLREIVCERQSQLMQLTPPWSYFKKLSQSPQP